MTMLRSPLALTCRRCLCVAWGPALAAVAIGLAASRWLDAPIAAEVAAPGANSPWLHFVLFTSALACAFAGAAFWPLFAARRPGNDWLVRLQRGPLQGTGASIAGALAAQLLLTVPIVLVMAPLLGAPATAAPHVALEPPADALLDGPGQSLRFTAAAPCAAREVQLRPLAAPPAGPLQPARLQVFVGADQVPLAASDDALTVEQTGQVLRVAAAGRTIDTLRIVQTAGNVPLFFPRGSVVVVGDGPHSGTVNALLVALVYCVPAFAALAIAGLCGRWAGLPTVLGVLGSVLFVLTFAGVGPADDAVRELMRGHWLPSVGLFSRSLPSLAAGSLAMILTMLLPRNPHR